LQASSKYKIERKATVHDKVRLKIDNVSDPALTDIDFSMKTGDFMVVIGQVGCGKTSLLYSIM
jgi:ABC-type taurine transport system ATPase subunit